MSDITAKIAAKGCSATGITETLASSLHANLGSKVVAVVELMSEARTEKSDGKETVALSIISIEPATDDQTENHLREIARALHRNRHLAGGDTAQGRLDVGDEPNVADVLKAGAALRPHPFLPDDAASENPICDVCGSIEASAVHSMQVALDDLEADQVERDEQLEADAQDGDLDAPDGGEGAEPVRHLGVVPNPFDPTSKGA